MRKIGGDKRAQGLQLSTIILIVLGIAVLVFLIWGFSVGWGNFWDRITAYTGGGSNADAVKSGCELSCAGQQENDFCENPKTLKRGDKPTLRGSCENFKSELGISCDIKCGSKVYGQTCEDLGGEEIDDTKWTTDCGEADEFEKKEDTKGLKEGYACCVPK